MSCNGFEVEVLFNRLGHFDNYAGQVVKSVYDGRCFFGRETSPLARSCGGGAAIRTSYNVRSDFLVTKGFHAEFTIGNRALGRIQT